MMTKENSTELKSIFEKILYAKVYGTIQRTREKYGWEKVEDCIDSNYYFNEVLTNDRYYGSIRAKLYEGVIRRVVKQAQDDFINRDDDTYDAIQAEFDAIKERKENLYSKNTKVYVVAPKNEGPKNWIDSLDADNELKDKDAYGEY